MPSRFTDEEWDLAFGTPSLSKQMAPPPEEEPGFWEGLRRRAFSATEGDWRKTFGPSAKLTPVPEDVISDIPLVGKPLQSLAHTIGGVQGLLVDAPARKMVGLPTSATNFRLSDLLMGKLDPTMPSRIDANQILSIQGVVDAYNSGDINKSNQLLEKYRTEGGFVGGLQRAGVELITDPTNPLSFSGKAGLKTLSLGSKAGLALLVPMAEQGFKMAKDLTQKLYNEGFTAENVAAIPQVLAAAGMPALAGKSHYDAFKISKAAAKADLAAAVEGARADNPNPYDAMLEALGGEDEGLPAPPPGFRDVDLSPDLELTPGTGFVVRDMANKVLAASNEILASGELREGGGQLQEGPSTIREVIVLDRNEVPHPETGEPTPVTGKAARIGDVIYITKRGVLNLLQTDSSAGLLRRVNNLLAHEVPHFQDETIPSIKYDPISGAPLPEGAQPTKYGHAPGVELYDDSVKDLNQLWLERNLEEKLNQHPALVAEAARLQESGFSDFFEPTDVSPTAGSYQAKYLALAAKLQGRELPFDVEAAAPPEAMRPPPTGPEMDPYYHGTVIQMAQLAKEWLPGPGRTEVANLPDGTKLIRSGADNAAIAVIRPDGVVTDVSAARPGSMAAGRVLQALKASGAKPPEPGFMSPQATQAVKHLSGAEGISQAGAIRNLFNKARGLHEVETDPAKLAEAGFADSRFHAAILADKARQAAARVEEANAPKGPQVGDRVMAPPRPGKLTFDPPPPITPSLPEKLKAFLGLRVKPLTREQKRDQPRPGHLKPGSLRQQVPPGSMLATYFQSRNAPARGRIADYGRINWFKAADEAIALGKEIAGAEGPTIQKWRARNIEVDDFHSLLQNLMTGRTYAKDAGNTELWNRYNEKIEALRKNLPPRVLGISPLGIGVHSGTATPKQLSKYRKMSTKTDQKELSPLERRVERSNFLEEGNKDKATDLYKHFRAAVFEHVKAVKEKITDPAKLERMTGEVTKVFAELQKEIQHLPPAQQADILNQTKGLIRKSQAAFAKMKTARTAGDDARAKAEEAYFKDDEEGGGGGEDISQAGGAKKPKEKKKARSASTKGKVVSQGWRVRNGILSNEDPTVTAARLSKNALKPPTYRKEVYQVSDPLEKKPQWVDEAITTTAEDTPKKPLNLQLKDFIWGERRRAAVKPYKADKKAEIASAMEDPERMKGLQPSQLTPEEKQALTARHEGQQVSTVQEHLKNILARLTKVNEKVEEPAVSLKRTRELKPGPSFSLANAKALIRRGVLGRQPRQGVPFTDPEMLEAFKANREKHAPRNVEAKEKREEAILKEKAKDWRARALPPRKKPATAYSGEKLEDLGPSELEQNAHTSLAAALGEAAKKVLKPATWTQGKGLLVEGRAPLEGEGILAKIAAKKYVTAEFLQGFQKTLLTEDPHGSFLSQITNDDRAWRDFKHYVNTWVNRPGGKRLTEKSFDAFRFSGPTKQMVKRMWRLAFAPEDILRKIGLDTAKLDLSPQGRLALFQGGVQNIYASLNTVVYKYFGPETAEGKASSRLSDLLTQMREEPKGKGSLRGVAAAAEPSESKPAFWAERSGPHGGRQEVSKYFLDWKTSRKKNTAETLKPMGEALKELQRRLGVTLPPKLAKTLAQRAVAPTGTGRKKRFSTTELGKDLLKIAVDPTTVKPERVSDELGVDIKRLKEEIQPLQPIAAKLVKELKPKGRAYLEAFMTRELASKRARSRKEVGKGDTFVFPSIQGEGKSIGIPETANPYGSSQVTVRSTGGKHIAKPTPDFPAGLQKVKVPGELSKIWNMSAAIKEPFFHRERVLSHTEVKLQKDRDAARILAGFDNIKSTAGYKAGLKKVVDDATAEFDRILDSLVTTAGIKKAPGKGSGRLWTKRAIYEEQVATFGSDWKKANPYDSFRPELYMKSLSESIGEFFETEMDVLQHENKTSALQGEYYYDEAGLKAAKRDAQWKAEKDYETRIFESKYEFEELKLKDLEAREAAAKEDEALKEQESDPLQMRSLLEEKPTEPEYKTKALKKGVEEETKRQEAEVKKQLEEEEAYYESKGWKDYPPDSGEDISQAGGAKKKQQRQVYAGLPSEHFAKLAEYFDTPGYKKSKWWSTQTAKRVRKNLFGVGELLNLSRPLVTAVDLSATFRNTWVLSTDQLSRDLYRVFTNPRAKVETSLYRNIMDMSKAFASEKTYKRLNDALEAEPYFNLLKDGGGRLISESAPAEGFVGKDTLYKVFDKLGVPGKVLKFLVRGSERSYNYYTNKAMRDGYKYGLEVFDKAGLFDRAMREGASYTDFLKMDAANRDLIKHIDMAASRKALSKDENINQAANYFFYSLQMNWSRLALLGHTGSYFRYYSTPESKSYARRQIMRSIAGGMAGVTLVSMLAKLAGEDPTIEDDPTSSDFMKVRFGPIAFDGWGGIQQWLRVGAQVASTSRKELASGRSIHQSPSDTITRFLRGKLGPGASLVVDTLERRTAEGEAYDLHKDPTGYAVTTLKNMLLPMSLEDMGGIMRENPRLGFLVPLMLLGHGVSTSRGAKEKWLGMNPFNPEVREAHRKQTGLEKELKMQGVRGPRLSKKVTIPGRDAYGNPNYYTLTPGEVAEFEKEYMPLVTDLLVEFTNSAYYKKLNPKQKPVALTRAVHRLNERYGAATRLKKKYYELAKAGKISPSNKVGSELEEALADFEASPKGKGEKY